MANTNEQTFKIGGMIVKLQRISEQYAPRMNFYKKDLLEKTSLPLSGEEWGETGERFCNILKAELDKRLPGSALTIRKERSLVSMVYSGYRVYVGHPKEGLGVSKSKTFWGEMSKEASKETYDAVHDILCDLEVILTSPQLLIRGDIALGGRKPRGWSAER